MQILSLFFFRMILILSLVVLLFSCFGQAQAARLYRENLAEKIVFEEGQENGEEPGFREILTIIQDLESDMDIIISKQRKRAYFFRILGYRYMDEKMWGLAHKAFDDSVALEPDSTAALYNRALSLSYMAKSGIPEFRQKEYFIQAESDYRRVLEISPRFTPAMYALAVLLIFELDKSSESEKLLREFLSVERSHINARFLLARVLYGNSEILEARDVYKEIEDIASDKEKRQRAIELGNSLAEVTYGS